MEQASERGARPGEVCSCGRPAIIVYMTEKFGDVGHCGISDGGQHTKASERAEATTEPGGLPAILAHLAQPMTVVPAACPLSWCQRGAEHPFQGHPAFPADGVDRYHEAVIQRDAPCAVTVSAVERLDDSGASMSTPTITLMDPEGYEFTAAQARAQAAVLLRAADLLDEITGGAR